MKPLVYLFPFLLAIVTITSCQKKDVEPQPKPFVEKGQKAVSNPYPGPLIPVYRFVKNGRHFFTTTLNEGYAAGMTLEGQAFRIRQHDPNLFTHMYENWKTETLHRYYNTQDGSHLLKVHNNTELSTQWAPWVYEGLTGIVYSYPGDEPNGVEIHRYRKSNPVDYLFTVGTGELGSGAAGYVHEGLAFWAIAN